MFGGNNNVPIVFRIVIGRQWGNGPQHSQAFYSLFGNVLGLKVVIPSTPRMAKGLMVSAVRDRNPVVILEPRWLYSLRQEVPIGLYSEPLDRAVVVKKGKDITVVAYGDGLVAALEAVALIGDQASVELIDLVSINPIDYKTIFASLKKTGRLLCVDTANDAFSVGSEVIAKAAQQPVLCLTDIPIAISCPNVPVPTSTALTEFYYPTKVDIANEVLRALHKSAVNNMLTFEELHLPPTLTIS